MSIRLEIDHSRQESGKEKRQQQLDGWNKGETAQCSADRSGHVSKLSFQTGAIFLSACQTSDYDEIERILALGDSKIINYANSDGLTALHQASIDGNLKMIKYLIDKGADINVTDKEGWNCLHASASCGYVEIAKYLVEAGINITEVTADGELASDVCIEDSPKMEKFLESIYADTDKDAEREKEEKEMFRDSIKYYYYFQQHAVKYKPEPVDDVGASPLHVAASKGYTVVLRVLLEAGFYIDRKDADGWTPLHAAAHWEQFECCKILAAYGASFVTKNSLSQKPCDVVSDDLAADFKDLQRNRFSKENLPKLPDLPPPSPTNALILPDEPQPEKTNDDAAECEQQAAQIYHPVRLVSTSSTDVEPTQPKEPEQKKKRSKYGVDDEQVSLGEARSKFGEAIKQKQPRPKRVPSTTENLEDDKRKHMSQPVPNQLTNVEQKNKAKQRRASRRSTQGVTLDIVNDARKLIEDKKKEKDGKRKNITTNTAEQKLPGGYIPQNERKENREENSTKNPQMEKLKLMSQMMNKRNKQTPVVTVSRKSPSSSSSSDVSPLDETPKLPKESKVDGAGDPSSRLARSSASSKLQAYPDHLSTIRSEQKSPVPERNNSTNSTSSRLRTDSESRRHDSTTNDAAIDYRKLYEDERQRHETQKKQNSEHQREILQLKQRIASLEAESSKMTIVSADNSKLKQENASLIRIISKLNKH